MSSLGDIYELLQGKICGKHPNLRPWHFQWLAMAGLNRDFEEQIERLEGRVADVGCGDKPYAQWLNRPNVVEHRGIDIGTGPKVDVSVKEGQPWPLDDEYFDAAICTQVLEHVRDPSAILAELRRILKPGARIVISVPFIYNVHGAPMDFRRLSAEGLNELFAEHFDVIELKRQGGVGNSLGTLFLNWIECSMNLTMVGRLAKGLLFPLWVFLSAVVNFVSVMLDKLDRTQSFYSNVLLIGVKK